MRFQVLRDMIKDMKAEIDMMLFVLSDLLIN